jgi:hypothetical protein
MPGLERMSEEKERTNDMNQMCRARLVQCHTRLNLIDSLKLNSDLSQLNFHFNIRVCQIVGIALEA